MPKIAKGMLEVTSDLPVGFTVTRRTGKPTVRQMEFMYYPVNAAISQKAVGYRTVVADVEEVGLKTLLGEMMLWFICYNPIENELLVWGDDRNVTALLRDGS